MPDSADRPPGPETGTPFAGPAPSAPAAAGSSARALHRPKLLLLGSIALLVIVLDLITKVLVVSHLQDGESRRILGGLVYLSLFRNSGAAFSMATGMTWILSLIVIAVIVVILRMSRRLRSTAWAICFGLILGGAIGNLIDRIFRSPGFLRGHVVDFVSVFAPNGKYFAIFNLADSAITCGGIALVITALVGVELDGTRARRKRTTTRPDTGPEA